MAEVVFQEMEFEFARPEMLPNVVGIPQHARITVAHLNNAACDPRLEHVWRHGKGLQGLHYLLPQDPGLPVQADMRDLGDTDPGLVEAILHGLERKADVMLP